MYAKKNTAAEAVVEKKKKQRKKTIHENDVFFLWPISTAKPTRFTRNSLSALTRSFQFTFDIDFFGKYAIIRMENSKITNFFFDSLLLKSIHTHNCRKHTEVGRTSATHIFPFRFVSFFFPCVPLLFVFYAFDTVLSWSNMLIDGVYLSRFFSLSGCFSLAVRFKSESKSNGRFSLI